MGNAGSEQAGSGRRPALAAYVSGHGRSTPNWTLLYQATFDVIDDYHQLTKVMWPPIKAGAFGLPFVVGFMSERQAPGPGEQMSLRNVVLRFADPASASGAPRACNQSDGHAPTPDVTPIVTEPEQAIPIPGHPDAGGPADVSGRLPDRERTDHASTRTAPTCLCKSCDAPPGPIAKHRWPRARSTFNYR